MPVCRAGNYRFSCPGDVEVVGTLTELARGSANTSSQHLRTTFANYVELLTRHDAVVTEADRALIIAILENPDSPVPHNLDRVFFHASTIPDEFLAEVAALSWRRVAAARRDEFESNAVFLALPPEVIESYRDQLFAATTNALPTRTNVRILGALAGFEQEGQLALAGLLARMPEEDQLVAQAIYETVFRDICDAGVVQSDALRETLLDAIEAGYISRFEWSRERRVLGVLIAFGLGLDEINALGADHSSHHRDARTAHEVGLLEGWALCR